jgi:biotin carboxylase
VDGIVTMGEFTTPVAAQAAAALGLAGNDAALADAPRNKVVMADRFQELGVQAPATLVAGENDAPADLVERAGWSFPVVAKPADNAGSSGVSLAYGPGDLPAAVALARCPADGPYGPTADRRVILQEYVAGREFSVESLTQGGVTQHVCVTRKTTTEGRYRVETGHLLPARLDAPAGRAVLSEVTKALAAVGVTNSVSHTEVIVRPDGTCAVIEVAARIGAGRIGVLAELALGVSIPKMAVRICLGQPVSAKATRRLWAATRLVLSPGPGVLNSVQNMPAVGGDVHLSTLTRGIGSQLSGPQSNAGRVGHFVVVGPDEDYVGTRADALSRQVQVRVTPGSPTAGDL